MNEGHLVAITARGYLGTKTELWLKLKPQKESRKMDETRVLGSCRIKPLLKPTLPWTSHLQEAKNCLYRYSLLMSMFPLLVAQSTLTNASPIPVS